MIETGWLLISAPDASEKGLYFIFHAEEGGILGANLTEPHADIPYHHFAAALQGEDRKNEPDKIVLLGGPEQSDDALLILHDAKVSDAQSFPINDDFAFKSYRFVLVPGKPPDIVTDENRPGRISFARPADFLVIVGFRLWEMAQLQKEMAQGLWTLAPASPLLVFGTPREARLAHARLAVN